MKIILVSLNLIALVVCIVWYIESNYEREPLVVMLTLTATLVGLLFTKTKSLKIKGNKNNTKHSSNDGSAEIEGDENVTEF